MRDDEFEWDEAKAARNVQAHEVTFEMAREAFADALGESREDRREVYGEERYILLGMAAGRLLHVTYTYRGERIRIVSARIAEPSEKRRYHEQNARE